MSLRFGLHFHAWNMYYANCLQQWKRGQNQQVQPELPGTKRKRSDATLDRHTLASMLGGAELEAKRRVCKSLGQPLGGQGTQKEVKLVEAPRMQWSREHLLQHFGIPPGVEAAFVVK